MDLVHVAAQALDEKKAEDITVRDVRGVSEITDFCIVACGNSPPHLKALFNEAQHALKQRGLNTYRRAGDPESGWLVLDYIDFIIHIFLRETREYYAIEELWSEAPVLEHPQP